MDVGRNPYLIEGPALISFSGGRTSAYMLYQILQAHGGTLPADVVVAFANTGKEREETLRFVHECGTRWGVNIRWLEWKDWPAKAPHADRFVEVGYNSAARNGEPFEALITKLGFAPNALMRACSAQLKIRPIEYFARSLGFPKGYKSVVGLRHDEGYRCIKQYARNATGKDYYVSTMPMDKAKATERDVLRFWLGESMRPDGGERPQGFDLGLYSYEGNCDLCMLKRRAKLLQIIRDEPSRADWWIEQEERLAATVRTREAAWFGSEPYASLRNDALSQGLLSFMDDAHDDDEHDAECGLWCADDQPIPADAESVPA